MICNKCNLDKPLSAFKLRKHEYKDGTVLYKPRKDCIDCYNQYFRVYLKKNTKIHQQRVYKNKIAFKRRIVEDKLDRGCYICGYKKCGQSLHYHHLDPVTKLFSIANLTRNLINLDKLNEEIAKCVILCANCHGEVEAGITELTIEKVGV